MYREFFKLREHPFSLTPDTDFWFGAAGHRDAMNVLCAMLRLGEGFIKVSGEIGLGARRRLRSRRPPRSRCRV